MRWIRVNAELIKKYKPGSAFVRPVKGQLLENMIALRDLETGDVVGDKICMTSARRGQVVTVSKVALIGVET